MSEQNLVRARVDAIRRLVRRKAAQPLARALAKSSAADIAEAASHLTREETLYLTRYVNDDMTGEVLLALGDAELHGLVAAVKFDTLVRWLKEMEPDDLADLLERLPEELRRQALSHLEAEDRAHVEELLAWPPDSAGGIMSPVVFRLEESTTCRDAIAALQEQGDVEMVFYLYVENEAGQLVGVTSLRNLLMNSPSKPLSEIMATDVVAVQPETDQEEVARITSRYNFLAIPVVDDTRKLLGIVTVDDVLDVVREEAAEDMFKMAGVEQDADVHGSGAPTVAFRRLTWLSVTLVGGVGLSELIGSFEATLARHAILAGFIPVVMGIGGNVGIQAATITVRNLATGAVTREQGAAGLVAREGRVGLVLGVVLGTALLLYCFVRYYPDWHLGAAVSSSIVLAVLVSAVLGASIPLTLNRLGVDPAVATGPFVTTTIDITAIVVYFVICTQVFGF